MSQKLTNELVINVSGNGLVPSGNIKYADGRSVYCFVARYINSQYIDGDINPHLYALTSMAVQLKHDTKSSAYISHAK